MDVWSERGAAEQLHSQAARFQELGEHELAETHLALSALLAPDTDLSATPALEPVQLRNLGMYREAWVVPWALAAGRHKWLSIALDTFAYQRPFVEPHVEMRIELREDGWHAWPPGHIYASDRSEGDPRFVAVAQVHRR